MKPIKVRYASNGTYVYATMIDVIPSTGGETNALLNTGDQEAPFIIISLGSLELNTRGDDGQELKPHEQKNLETVTRALNLARNGLEVITALRGIENVHRQASNTIDTIDSLMEY